jgi:hypothetical protein
MQPQNAQLLEAWLGDGAQFKRISSKLLTRLTRLAQFIRAGDPSGALPEDLAEVLAEPLDKHVRVAALAAAERAPALALARRVAGVFDGLKAQALARYREQ